jgi:uncharacterized protein (DUF983 family)
LPVEYRRHRPLATAIRRGLRRTCPRCGGAPSFRGYLTLVEACPSCGEPLGKIRPDDFPPYVTIFVVGHIVVPLALLAERTMAPPLAVQIVLWPALALLLTLALLPLIKGAVVGLMWALGLRGDEPQGLERP